MNPIRDRELNLTRRQLFGRTSQGIGVMALASLLNPKLFAQTEVIPLKNAASFGGLPDLPHFPPKAKRIIYLHQSGAPSQIDLFDYKPKLAALAGTELPDSVRKGQRITGMTSGQNSLPIAPSIFKLDRKSTRLNSSHMSISYAVFCLKKKSDSLRR